MIFKVLLGTYVLHLRAHRYDGIIPLVQLIYKYNKYIDKLYQTLSTYL